MTEKEQVTSQYPDYTVSLLRRLGAISYDAIIIASLIFIVAQWSLVISDTARQSFLFQVAMLFNIFGVAFFYLAYFWRKSGQTVGMKAWKITLVSKAKFVDGTASPFISWKQSAIRYVVATLSWVAIGLGFIFTLFHAEKWAWHDRASGSFLVRSK